MSRCTRMLGLAVMCVCFLPLARGDSRAVYRMTVGGREWTTVMYRRGGAFRTETLNDPSGGWNVQIFSAARRAMFQIDEISRQYSESSGPDALARLAGWIAHPPRTRDSGKTTRVYYETVDTGERRAAFGFTAQRLILRERRVAEPGACGASFTRERDGWYAPVPKGQAGGYFSASLVGGFIQCRDTIVEKGARFHPGMVFEETETARDSLDRRTAETSSVKRELLDFSTAPLPASLFDIPPGFTRQDSADWRAQLAMDWAQLERAFNSWFD